MNLKLCLLSALALLLSACSNNGEWRDEGIDPGIRKEIGTLQTQLVAGLATNNLTKILAVCSDSFRLQSRDRLPAWVRENQAVFRPALYRTEKQFHVRMSRKGIVRIQSDNQHFGAYEIAFHSRKRESVVTIGCFKDSILTYSLLTIFGKYGSRWQLDYIRLGRYKILGRDAMSWYEQAEDEFVNGDDLDAANHLSLSLSLLDTTDQALHYRKEKDAFAFNLDLRQRIDQQYHFPMTDEEVDTKPVIFSTTAYAANGNVYPLIAYASKYPLNDSAALKAECRQVHRTITRLFRGIDKNEFVSYYIYNTIPRDRYDDHPHLVIRKSFKWGAED